MGSIFTVWKQVAPWEPSRIVWCSLPWLWDVSSASHTGADMSSVRKLKLRNEIGLCYHFHSLWNADHKESIMQKVNTKKKSPSVISSKQCCRLNKGNAERRNRILPVVIALVFNGSTSLHLILAWHCWCNFTSQTLASAFKFIRLWGLSVEVNSAYPKWQS